MSKKAFNKYKSLPVQVRASFWFLICAFLQKGISFITTPIFTRLLTTDEYGIFNVYNSWMGILTVIVTLNLGRGVFVRGMVKYKDEKEQFASSLQGLSIVLVAVWSVVYLIFSKQINQYTGLTTVQMVLMMITIWMTAVFTFWSVEQRVNLEYRMLVIITAIVSIARPALGIILVVNTSEKVTARILGIAAVDFIAYIGLLISQLRRGKVFYSRKFWKHALSFNVPLVPHYLSQTVLNSADRIMINSMVNASAAGIYGLAYSISQIMTMFNTALMQTVEPWLYEKINDKKIEDISKVAYPTFVIIALVNLALMSLAPEVVRIFAPAAYYDAIWVIPPVAMSVFFTFSYAFFAVFEFYYKKTNLVAVASCAGAVLNIILNYIFIKIFGYYAAGYTTLFCYIVYAMFHYFFMKKLCKQYLDGREPFSTKIYLLIATVFMVVGFTLLFLYNYSIIRYSIVVIALVVAFIKRKMIIKTIKMLMSARKKKT
ncbi:MAG: oligosaccharide flippase family protein [Oscillospiraceae bacterium]|nr:oligosaccharide flippase family protein [Oscillospiraceae bacterium]